MASCRGSTGPDPLRIVDRARVREEREGLIDLIPQYFTEARLGIDYPPPLTHPEYFYGFIGVAIAWQVLFLIISRDPVRYRTAMLAAVLEKLAFDGAAAALYWQGRLAAIVLAFGVVDLVFALLFVVAYLRTPPDARVAANVAHA